MKMCLTAGRSAVGATVGAALLAVSVSACTGGSGSSIPSVFTPSPPGSTASSAQAGGSRTPSPDGQSTTGGRGSAAGGNPAGAGSTSHAGSPSTARASGDASGARETPGPGKTASRANASASATLAQVPPPSPVQYPTSAPETGGGGTAGLRDGILFGAGGAAILAGLASLAYRRRLARNSRPTR
jgi:hypothetical protein